MCFVGNPKGRALCWRGVVIALAFLRILLLRNPQLHGELAMVDELRLKFKSLGIVVFLVVASCALAVGRLSLRAELNQNSSSSSSPPNQVANANRSHVTSAFAFVR